MHSPFAHSDQIVSKAAVVFTVALGLLLLSFSLTGLAEAKTQTFKQQVVTPAKALYATATTQVAQELTRYIKEEEARLQYELEMDMARQQEAAFDSNKNADTTKIEKSTSTKVIINNQGSNNAEKKATPQNQPAQVYEEDIQVIQQPYAPAPNNTSPGFDQAAWDAEVAKIKADSQARYEQSLKDQQAWSDQKSAENAAWMDEQRAKAQAEQDAWKAEHGW